MLGPESYAAVVLTGGTARRMGGGDKTALELGAGHTVLDHLVSGLDPRVRVVVVGPPRPLERPVLWARENPPGGGPAAALLAGIAAMPSEASVTWIVALAGDQPYAADAVPALLAATAGHDAVLGRDPGGRDQLLLAAYRVAALPRSVPPGTSVRSLLDGLAVRRVDLSGPLTLDVDRPQDLARARAAFRP